MKRMALLILLASPALAHDPATVELEPDEDLTVTCDFDANNAVPSGVTCDTPGSVVVTVRKGTDGSPGDIVTSGPSATGANMTLKLDPGGSRHGNRYQLKVPCTFSNGDILNCNFLLDVSRETLR